MPCLTRVITTAHQIPVTRMYVCNPQSHAFDLHFRYEGELFTWFLDLMTVWESEEERDLMWIEKRAMLQAVNYTTEAGRNITVQRGFWFSAHENWKLAMLPYLDVEVSLMHSESLKL